VTQEGVALLLKGEFFARGSQCTREQRVTADPGSSDIVARRRMLLIEPDSAREQNMAATTPASDDAARSFLSQSVSERADWLSCCTRPDGRNGTGGKIICP
jgi:hypothetical protein